MDYADDCMNVWDEKQKANEEFSKLYWKNMVTLEKSENDFFQHAAEVFSQDQTLGKEFHKAFIEKDDTEVGRLFRIMLMDEFSSTAKEFAENGKEL